MNLLQIVTLLLALAHLARADEICCQEAGCFDNNAPFNIMPLPDCPQKFNIIYRMYTRTNRINGELFSISTVPSIYDSSHRTVFMAHGWANDGYEPWLTDMKDAFLAREDINVVIVDWGGGAHTIDYFQAAANTRSVGAYTALVFQNLLRVSGSASSRMWCVGHSLGSHVCGHTGMKMPSGSRLGRVTGLDPAGPVFEQSSDLLIGINPTSGSFVDIIHTDSDVLGTLRTLGHIDFYPNGGLDQPGCIGTGRDLKSLPPELLNDEISQLSLCSHERAFRYMIESIKQDCFQARDKCTNYLFLPLSCSSCTCGAFPCAFMGYAADIGCITEGIYYLGVSIFSPWCRG